MPQQQRQQDALHQYNNQQQRQPRKFDHFPVTLTEALHHLLDLKLISLRNMPPPLAILPSNYDANARCEFHSDGVGHSTDNCFALKCKVQDLLDAKAIEFTLVTGPNVTQNPMPRHGGGVVNMIDDNGEMLNLIMDVGQITTPLCYVKRYFLDNFVFPG